MVSSAIRTDFILSAEIVAIALGTVAAAPFSQQVAVLVGVSVVVTVGDRTLFEGVVPRSMGVSRGTLEARGDASGAGERLEHLILTYPNSALVPQARRELETLRSGVA